MTTSLTSYLADNALPELSDDQMIAALSETREEQRTGTGLNVQYLAFSGKTGSYALGREREHVSDDQLYILEPKSVVEGWICWKSSKPIDRVEWSVFNKRAAVAEQDLADHSPYNTKTGEGWHRALGFGCISTDGARTNVKFVTNSVSGRNAISDLLDEIVRRLSSGAPSLPVFGFSAEQFTAQGATNYKPKFVVHGWVTRDEVDAFFAGSTTLDEMVYGDSAPKTAAKTAPRARR